MPNLDTNNADSPCPKCHQVGSYVRGEGKGPHAAALLCGKCGCFCKWLRHNDSLLNVLQAAPKQESLFGENHI